MEKTSSCCSSSSATRGEKVWLHCGNQLPSFHLCFLLRNQVSQHTAGDTCDIQMLSKWGSFTKIHEQQGSLQVPASIHTPLAPSSPSLAKILLQFVQVQGWTQHRICLICAGQFKSLPAHDYGSKVHPTSASSHSILPYHIWGYNNIQQICYWSSERKL